jgi:hypothetical protein
LPTKQVKENTTLLKYFFGQASIGLARFGNSAPATGWVCYRGSKGQFLRWRGYVDAPTTPKKRDLSQEKPTLAPFV